MRLNVYNLTTKILAHRPRVVCFVGKKIWDIYEGVVLKTAGPPVVAAAAHVPPSEAPYLVKLEEDEEGVKAERVEPGGSISLEQGNSGGLKIVTLAPTGVVKVEPSTPPKPSPSGSAAAASRSTTPAKSSKTGIDWSKPRGARLPHDGGYTYFWVTPNTSGLERTPVSRFPCQYARPSIATAPLSARAKLIRSWRNRSGSSRIFETLHVLSNRARRSRARTVTSTSKVCGRQWRAFEQQRSRKGAYDSL
jgi:TDG/mug DNA glycosylase family protein